VLAGPLVGTFFSELGANVVKVENKLTGGDMTRQWFHKKESRDKKISSYYACANYGKKPILADLKDPDDRKRVYGLIRDADILIQNFKGGTAEKLGVDYATVNTLNPRIIYASLTGFGEDDPRSAFDIVLQAETGYMSMSGDKDGHPVRMPVAMIDILAAHHLKEAILVALIQRMKTGAGKEISVSLYQAALASLINQATNWLMVGHIPERMGSLHPNISPYGDLFQTADSKYLVLAIGTDDQFLRFAEVTGIDPGPYLTNQQRLDSRSELVSELKPIIASRTAKEWKEIFYTAKVPIGIVKNLKEVFEDDDANEMLLYETVDREETVRVRTALV
ncbi:MAG: CoA transferase, partial [Bacteroidia bacterium]|nr:CoA transferase [Bacteroidia bacterium]